MPDVFFAYYLFNRFVNYKRISVSLFLVVFFYIFYLCCYAQLNMKNEEEMDTNDPPNLNFLPRLSFEQLKMYRIRKNLLTLLAILFVSSINN
jgi:hypothetical protein